MSNASVDVFPVPYTTTAILSVILLLQFVATAILLLIIIITIVKYRSELAGSYYAFLASACAAEVLYMIGLGLWVPICQLAVKCPGSLILDEEITSVSSAGWFVEILTFTLIGFERCAAVNFFQVYDRI